MFDRKVLKTRAKFVLSRSFFMSVIACAIVSIVTGGMVNFGVQRLQGINFAVMSDIRIIAIYAVVGLMFLVGIGISIFVAAPLKVGLCHFMLRSADMDTNLDNLMHPFRNNYKNIVWVTFVKNLYVALWSLLGLVPMVIGFWKFGLSQKIAELLPMVQNDSVSAAMSLTTISSGLVLLTIIFMIPAYIKELQYSLVEYMLAENPNMPRAKAIGKSKEMMVGNKWAYVKLAISFFGWYVLANTACCIGNFLLMPYIEQTFAQMYLEISGQGKDYSGYTYQSSFDNFGNM